MAYYSKNGSGIDSSAYIYVQLQVTRTDYPTYSHFSVKSVAVSDTGSSSFIRGQVTTNQAGNSWTAATGWKSVSYNGTTTLATATFDVTRGASDKTAHIGAYAEGGGTGIYAGGTDYAWLDVTVPKVLAPNAPTGCSATYVSDSQASVSWTNGTTDTDHPRDATLVERKDGSNDWAQVASASGTASGYTDNGISANTQYQYRVRAKNVAGYSAYSTSGSIYTTPAAPSSVTLDKTAATTVQVDVTGTWGYAVTYDVESTYDGGSTWATVATSTSLPYSATVNAGTVQFRVRAVSGALSSAWTLSASLVTICPPLAPTIVQAPANPTAYGDGSTIAWTPNHPDGSTQSAAEVKVTNPGGTSTTYSVSTATSYSFTPNATGTWTAQVRTKGLDPSYGEWSQTVSWGVHNPPAVVITSPATDGTDIVALPLNVAWSVTDSTGVSAQRIIIEGSGGEILNRTLAGDVRTVSLNASDVALENGQTYTIRLRVMGGSGLVTEQTRIFDVAWLAPAAPVLQLTEGEGRSATIDVMDTRYTSSGTVLEASSSMMESLTIYGASVQDGTPSPSSPVPIQSVEGRNLLDTANIMNAYVTSSTIVANSSHVTMWMPCEPNTVYGISKTMREDGHDRFVFAYTTAQPAGGVAVEGYRVVQGSETTGYAGKRLTYGIKTGADAKFLVFWCGYSSDFDDSYSHVQVCKGFAKQLYLPYGSIGVRALGKNLSGAPENGVYFGVYFAEGYYSALSADYATSMVFPTNDADKLTLSTNYQFGQAILFCWDSGFNYMSSSITGSSGRKSVTFNVPSGVAYAAIAIRSTDASTIDVSEITDYQIEYGSTATAYEPYSPITIPISVTLRSLPDGTRDELRVRERKVLVKRCEETLQAVTDGVTGTVGVDVLSSTGEIANGAQVVYKLAAPQEIDLGAVSLPYVDGSAWVDAEVTPSIEAMFRPVDFPDQPAADSVDVIRVNADGSTWTVASGLSVGDMAIDPLPPLGVPVTYRATSSAASGSTASGEFTETFGGRDWVLNFGNAAQEHVEFIYNPQADLSLAQGGKGYHFADGGAGKGLPVFYPTTDRDYAGTLKFDTILYGDSDKVLDLCDRYPVAWLRDPFGHRWRAHVAPSVSHGVGQVWPVTLSWDAMRFEEAWDG